jgi:hypothetical protein
MATIHGQFWDEDGDERDSHLPNCSVPAVSRLEKTELDEHFTQ